MSIRYELLIEPGCLEPMSPKKRESAARNVKRNSGVCEARRTVRQTVNDGDTAHAQNNDVGMLRLCMQCRTSACAVAVVRSLWPFLHSSARAMSVL